MSVISKSSAIGKRLFPQTTITQLTTKQLLGRFLLFVLFAAIFPWLILSPFPESFQSDLYFEFVGKGIEILLIIWIFQLSTRENQKIINKVPFQFKKIFLLFLYFLLDRFAGLIPYIIILAFGSLNALSGQITQEINNQTLTTIAKTSTPNTIQYILDGITLLIFAPIGEELLFRGVLFNYLRKRISVIYAIFLTAFIFAAFHFEIALFLSLFVSGLILTYVYYKYENITYSIILHGMINAAALLLEILSHTHP